MLTQPLFGIQDLSVRIRAGFSLLLKSERRARASESWDRVVQGRKHQQTVCRINNSHDLSLVLKQEIQNDRTRFTMTDWSGPQKRCPFHAHHICLLLLGWSFPVCWFSGGRRPLRWRAGKTNLYWELLSVGRWVLLYTRRPFFPFLSMVA